MSNSDACAEAGRAETFSLFGAAFHRQDICLFFEANSNQLPLVARHIHLCFHSRKRDESHLASYPGLQSLLIDQLRNCLIHGFCRGNVSLEQVTCCCCDILHAWWQSDKGPWQQPALELLPCLLRHSEGLSCCWRSLAGLACPCQFVAAVHTAITSITVS